jgi:hypothetical protein
VGLEDVRMVGMGFWDCLGVGGMREG